jgi:hypothetical protein
MKQKIQFIFLISLITISQSKGTKFQLLNTKGDSTTISFKSENSNKETSYDIKSNKKNLKLLYNTEKELLEINSTSNINIKVPLYINSSSIDILLNSQQSSFKYNNIDQFILYSIDTFEEKDNKWSNYVLSTCGNNNNFILGGYCHFSNNETQKKFYIETKHKYIKIKATFNFFDFWEGEFAYLKFNNEIIWYDNYNWCDKVLIRNCKKYGINVCGSEFPDKIGVPIDVILPYEDNEFVLTFGSKINKNPCDASWGVSDVSIYIK